MLRVFSLCLRLNQRVKIHCVQNRRLQRPFHRSPSLPVAENRRRQCDILASSTEIEDAFGAQIQSTFDRITVPGGLFGRPVTGRKGRDVVSKLHQRPQIVHGEPSFIVTQGRDIQTRDVAAMQVPPVQAPPSRRTNYVVGHGNISREFLHDEGTTNDLPEINEGVPLPQVGLSPSLEMVSQQIDGNTMVQDNVLRDHDRSRDLKSSQIIGRDEIKRLRGTIWNAHTSDDAWDAYQTLSSLNGTEPRTRHLRRLGGLLASTRPRTRTVFLRLRDVLARIRSRGGTIYPSEWNALIDCAGKGWRKTRIEDYKAAVGVYNEMQEIALKEPDQAPTNRSSHRSRIGPNVVTYTTLLDIATRSENPALIRHAGSLFRSSELLPTRITSLVLLRYRRKAERMRGIRKALAAMNDAQHDLGLDGINAFLWAYVHEEQFDVPVRIYNILRRNALQTLETTEAEHELLPDGHRNKTKGDYIDDIFIPAGMLPDEITFTAMIQGFAYHGHLIQALEVWSDMLTFPKGPQTRSCSARKQPPQTGRLYGLTLPVLRALFCGFARHGHCPSRNDSIAVRRERGNHWTAENLSILLDAFLQLPALAKPSDRTIYWLMVAVGKTSGNNQDRLREVWGLVEERFPSLWRGRLDAMAKAFPATRGKEGRTEKLKF
ncbi:hypothetical protein BD410DRAFT_892992 [Rickenella mellea]|uniref:Pentatricopeptide repeat protein n=1 Tax=Rickenella mellea TaxID=50990 RepID=A0A4R5XF30_9AGAM|nr:hypothetical protein BD410DRAFT_892992 [Rickenella mellea]